jgi:DNA mismatch repair ATPase MutS
LVPDKIRQRQEAISSLAGQADLRRLLTAKGLMTEGKAGNLHDLINWLNMPSQIYQHKILRVAIAVLTAANVAAIFFWLSTNNYGPLVAGILICRIMVAWFAKSAHAQHQKIAEKHALLEQYADILSVFSTVDANASPTLQELKSRAQAAHTAIRQLSRLTSFFEQQHNLFVSAILNSLAYYNLQCMIALERWKKRYKADYPTWIDAVGTIECFNSLAVFAFNNPEYIYPSPIDAGVSGTSPDAAPAGGLYLEATGLAHPLIPSSRRVANDFGIGHSERLILVTGSNMSGKTTFLRTIGVNLLLAQCGAPVCATSFRFTPMRLLTSLRISDSLQEQTSYFMAELKKLQRIVLRLRTGEPALVLIDEILRGTNSEDKTYGSGQFARKLTGYHCLSLFATHDLTLGRLEQECPGVIANYCFESVIEGDDLHFNYQLRQGIARNRNASFLMKKMDII